jgi:hypothetical protein
MASQTQQMMVKQKASQMQQMMVKQKASQMQQMMISQMQLMMVKQMNKSDAADADKKPEEKKEKTIYYVTDAKQQGQYIGMFKAAGMDAMILDQNIDQPLYPSWKQRTKVSSSRESTPM